jgi:ABC-type amino acid transport substrate-binding protein
MGERAERWMMLVRAIQSLALLLVLSSPHEAVGLPWQRTEPLRVLVVMDTARPEFFSANPDAPGFDREIVEGFAKLHRLKVELVTLASWEQLLPALLQEKGDIIAGGYRDTEERRNEIAFTSEVFPTRWVIATRKPHRAVRTLEELRAEKVGTMKGTSMADGLTALKIPFDDIPVGSFAEALRTGRVTVVAWSVERAMGGRRDDPALQFGMFFGKPGSLAFGVRKEDSDLRTLLNEYLGHLRRSGAWNRLAVKYFGEDVLRVLKEARGDATAP